MKIAVAQLDPVVGAFEANVAKIKEAYQRACSKHARLLLTPELGVCGYPLHDLVERPEMFERCEKAIQDLAAVTKGKKCALVVGHVARTPHSYGRAAQNVASIMDDGRRVFSQAKSLLPTYDIFDEARYFEPAESIGTWDCDGARIALAICEDLWGHALAQERRLYRADPVQSYKASKAALILSASASPYEWGKSAARESLHREVSRAVRAPLVYCNQVGATDEVLFDGGSFMIDADGKLAARLAFFETAFQVFDTSDTGDAGDPPAEIDRLATALVTGIREYFERTGFKKAILGLSGGIDSAVCAALAARALGPENVRGIAMPSQFSSSHSLEDAETIARALGIRYEIRPIKFQYSNASRELAEGNGTLAPLALENLQSRLRGTILMSLANHHNALVITTGNKSELATGYCTQYGDMVGAIAPIGDVVKTRVYELARWINQAWGAPIPDRSISKPPSAELRPNQTDQDSLPPYEALDALIEEYIEKLTPMSELPAKLARFSSQIASKDRATWIRDSIRKIELSEYKRRQAAPVLKVTHKAFGIGRRVPVAKNWDIST